MDNMTAIRADDSSASLRHVVVDRPLGEAILALHAADVASGFVEDKLGDLEYCQIPSGDARPSFLLQFNPRRAERPRADGPSAGCPLCLQAVRDRRQAFVAFAVSGRPMVALSNPWPFMPTHMTLAHVEHRPQAWNTQNPSHAAADPSDVVSDVVSLARALPGLVVIYNGADAGASIPHHRHYQTFALPTAHGPLPLERVAAGCAAPSWCGLNVIAAPGRFPLYVFAGTGPESEVVGPAVNLLIRWGALAQGAASANIIGRSDRSGAVSVYVVPRHRLFRRAVGFTGVLGSLETCGVFVVSSESDGRAIGEGRITHRRMWRALEALRPPQLDALLF